MLMDVKNTRDFDAVRRDALSIGNAPTTYSMICRVKTDCIECMHAFKAKCLHWLNEGIDIQVFDGVEHPQNHTLVLFAPTNDMPGRLQRLKWRVDDGG